METSGLKKRKGGKKQMKSLSLMVKFAVFKLLVRSSLPSFLPLVLMHIQHIFWHVQSIQFTEGENMTDDPVRTVMTVVCFSNPATQPSA